MYVEDPDKLIAWRMNFKYTAPVIVRLSKLFSGRDGHIRMERNLDTQLK